MRWMSRPMGFRSRLPGLLALLGLLVAQVVAAGRCAACETGGCDACTPCCMAPASAGADAAHCPLCVTEAAAACCASPADADGEPCTCQWEPRDGEPLAPAPSTTLELDGVGPQGTVDAVIAPPTALVARSVAARDIPQRPVRILWGVWRN